MENHHEKIQGPAIFLAQFAGDAAPFNSLDSIARWAAGLGYVGVQIPTWDKRLFDLERAAESQTYCDEVTGTLAGARHCRHRTVDASAGPARGGASGLRPADGRLCARGVRGKPAARTEWAIEQLKLAAKASQRLGLNAHATF